MAYVESRVAKHDVDLYEGDGPQNPSITMRLDRNERDFKRWQVIAARLTWLTVASIIAGLVDIFYKHIF